MQGGGGGWHDRDMEFDTRTVGFVVVAALAMPMVVVFAIGDRTSRAGAASIAAIIGAIAAGYAFGWEGALLAAVWCFAFGYAVRASGFIPSSLSDVADSVNGEHRRWWR